MDFRKINIQDLQLNHKIEVNPSNGSAVGGVDIPLSEGRNGFNPKLSLVYSSSARNSTYGIGWNLSGLSFIAVDTEQGLPQYDRTDNFSFNGKTPIEKQLVKTGSTWKPRTDENATHFIYYYRAKFEASFSRFEKWVDKGSGAIHWRMRSKDNILSIYGLNPAHETKIHDPKDASKTFIWLLEAQYDANGNAIKYEFKKEDGIGVDPKQSYEVSRLKKFNVQGFAQKYIHKIYYGNTKPLVPDNPPPTGNKWMFEIAFDYGQLDNRPYTTSDALTGSAWSARLDPYSNYSSGFEVRTYRLCRRILMYHHFDELGSPTSLTGIFEVTYNEAKSGSTIAQVAHTGIRKDLVSGNYSEKTLPVLTFDYTVPDVESSFHAVPEKNVENFPEGFNDSRTRWVDLFGEGIPGILKESEHEWYYKQNLGGGNFEKQAIVIEKPSADLGRYSIGDFNNDGNVNLFSFHGQMAGYFEYDVQHEKWSSFVPFRQAPNISHSKFLDIDADGFSDLVIECDDRLICYPFEGKEGFGKPFEFAKPISNGTGYAPFIGNKLSLDLFMADMSGDGLADQVQVSNGKVIYYPNLGNGRFGEAVLMDNAPALDFENTFDSARIRFYDLDGSGTSDIIYIGKGEIKYWINQSGNMFSDEVRIKGLPYIDTISSMLIMDFLGKGTPCLVWSNSLSANMSAPVHYLELTNGIKPRLLKSVNNGMGGEMQIEYGYSGTHYLNARAEGNPWISKIPYHFTVADKQIVIDHITNSRLVTEFKYRDGFYDGNTRRFVCFGLVDKFDTDLHKNATLLHTDQYVQPKCTRSWFHNGMFGWHTKRLTQFYAGDPDRPLLQSQFFEEDTPLSSDDFTHGFQGLAGHLLRQEVYATDETGLIETHPFQVDQYAYCIRQLQPGQTDQNACVYVYQSEDLSIGYDKNPLDPKLSHTLTLRTSAYGDTECQITIAYGRRALPARLPSQQFDRIIGVKNEFIHMDTLERYQIGVPYQSKDYQINNLPRNLNEIVDYHHLVSLVETLFANAVDFHDTIVETGPTTARLTGWSRTYFWNDAFDAPLNLAQVGQPIAVHHEETACFTQDFITQVYGSKVSSGMLDGSNEGHYTQKNGYWWQLSPTNHFNTGNGFLSLAKVERSATNSTEYDYDPYFLNIIKTKDPLGNTTSGKIDYNLIAPYQLTDPNDNVSEVVYDALGITITTSYQGTVLNSNGTIEKYGNDRVQNYIRRSDESFMNVLNDPDKYLQKVSSFMYYDFGAWEASGKPLQSIRLARESLLHDGTGSINSSGQTLIEVDYQDGFGRIIQAKRRVEDGPAIHFAVDGSVVLDPSGEPELLHTGNRWLVTGHVAYNGKQQPIRKFEPFFSNRHDYDSDNVLQTYGVSTENTYDALGRTVRTDYPNSTFSEFEFSPWTQIFHDQNDTVDRSLYKTFREILPVSDPEHMALDRSLEHKDTPTIVHLDPNDRDTEIVLTNNDGSVRRSQNTHDHRGNLTAITDARGLQAFEYRYDMLGRRVYEMSMDSGEKWIFYDSHNHPIHLWDGRNVHQHIEYDPLDRETTVKVDGSPGINQIMERFVYGEDASVSQAKEKNLRGALVKHYDQAGLQELKLAYPGGSPAEHQRRLVSDFRQIPDWQNPATIALLAPYSSKFNYDAMGRLIEEHLADGSIRNYDFNEGGGIHRVRYSTADGFYQNEEILKEVNFDPRGFKQNMVLGNDVDISYTYDDESLHMKRLHARRVSGTPRLYQDIRYTYDPVGNLIHTMDKAQQPASASPRVLEGLNVSSHQEFKYDALYQLIEAKGRVHQALLQHDYQDKSRKSPLPAQWAKGTRHISLNNAAAIERYTRTYAYDEAGNLTKSKHQGQTQNWTRSFWISANSNRRLPNLDLNGIPISDPENNFDENGNCTSLPHLQKVQWNYRNNISKAVVIDRSTQGKPNDEEYYIYGGDGMRVRKITQKLVDTVSNTLEITEKIYLKGCVIKRRERGGTETLVRSLSKISDGTNDLALVYSWDKDTAAVETDDISQKKIHYQLGNHMGSASLELDENGQIITYEEYFPFGGSSFMAGKSTREIQLKHYRYSGKEHDDFTGLYYFGYRYYAHWIGGWLSPDPLGPKDSTNLYVYVRNNPLVLIDPNGLQSVEIPSDISYEDIRREFTLRGQLVDETGQTTYEYYELSAVFPRFDGSVWEVTGTAHIRFVPGQEQPDMVIEINQQEIPELEAVWSREGGQPEIRPRRPQFQITIDPSPSEQQQTQPPSRRPERPRRPEQDSTPEEVPSTPEVVEPDEEEPAFTPAEPEVEEPEPEICEPEEELDPPISLPEVPPVSEDPVEECISSPCPGEGFPGTDRPEDDEVGRRFPGSGSSYAGSELIYRNPPGFTLEVPNNFDDEKISMYQERIRTDRGVGNRSAVPGERLSQRGSDVTDVIRRDNRGLLNDWVDAEAAAGRTRPPGHHVDHGVELQHIIRGDSTGGANTVRFEDHRFQPGSINTSQGSSARAVRVRSVAEGAPEDSPAGGVARTDEIDLLRNRPRTRAAFRGAGTLMLYGGPVLSYWGASQISDQRVRYAAYGTVGVETVGLGTYTYGRVILGGGNGLEQGLRVMGTGSRLMRWGGGVGMMGTSIYSGVEHYQQGEYGVLVGDAAGTGLGYMMLTQSGSTPLVAVTGTAMASNYAGDYVESVVTPEYGRAAGITAGTGTGLAIGGAVGGTLVAVGLVSNPVGWGILAVGGIAGFIGAVW